MVYLLYFNSTLVRLKEPVTLINDAKLTDFNSTLVRLKVLQGQHQHTPIYNFNSTLVRLKEKCKCSTKAT